MANPTGKSSMDLLMGIDSFSAGEKKSKKNPIPCPVCGKMLEYIPITGKSGRYWAHKSPNKCKEFYKSEEQIRLAAQACEQEAQSESSIVESEKKIEKIEKTEKIVNNKKEDRNLPNARVESGPDENPPEVESQKQEAEAPAEKKPKKAKIKKRERSPDKTTIENTQDPLPGIPIPITISLSEYESIGGDAATYNELFTGIDRLLNNVARDAFTIVEDEPAPKVKSLKRLTRRTKDNPESDTTKGSENDLEKRAKIENHKISISTAYTEQELKKKELEAPSEPESNIPFLIFNSTVYSLQKAINDTFSIGRADNNDIVIKDGTISSHHAVIKRYAGKYYIGDTSSNGTLIQTPDAKLRVPKGMFMELTPKANILLPHATLVFVC